MTGIDTSWLVDLEVDESPRHAGAVRLFQTWKSERSKALFVYYHVFLEFQHIVTDPRRFEKPLSMDEAIARTWFWMGIERIRILYPGERSMRRARLWLSAWNLGRKRILDTHMAAAYAEAGVSRILTANGADFKAFECFEIPEY